MKNSLFIIIVIFILSSCGKVGPLSLPENKLDKSVIAYPCDADCIDRFEAEKKRQQSVVINTE